MPVFTKPGVPEAHCVTVSGMLKGDTLPARRSIRLAKFDYAQGGHYFLTICAFQMRFLFGKAIVVLELGYEVLTPCVRDLIPVHCESVPPSLLKVDGA